MIDFVHPALLFILGALPILSLNGSVRKAYLLLVPAGDPRRAHDGAATARRGSSGRTS